MGNNTGRIERGMPSAMQPQSIEKKREEQALLRGDTRTAANPILNPPWHTPADKLLGNRVNLIKKRTKQDIYLINCIKNVNTPQKTTKSQEVQQPKAVMQKNPEKKTSKKQKK